MSVGVSGRMSFALKTSPIFVRAAVAVLCVVMNA